MIYKGFTPTRAARRRHFMRRGGFTLIEILIVVVILGILAAVVLPHFSNASDVARENTLKDDLRYLRTQILVYKAQHRDVSPGYPGGSTSASPTAAAFLAQMTLSTDEVGNTNPTATSVYKFGPYLSKVPGNPLHDGSAPEDLKIVTTSAAMTPDDTTGWIYNPVTAEIMANQSGTDQNGVAYASY